VPSPSRLHESVQHGDPDLRHGFQGNHEAPCRLLSISPVPADRLLPLSDGRRGFIECLQHGLGGENQSCAGADPFGRIRLVPALLLADGTAVLECAKVIGLAGWTG